MPDGRILNIVDENDEIIKIEAGKNQNPTLDTLKKIAKALDVSVDELIK